MLFKKITLILIAVFFFSSTYADSELSKQGLGLKIFNTKGMCITCHKLKASKNDDYNFEGGDIGPDLDHRKPLLPEIMHVLKNGKGVMPSFEGILTIEEMESVAQFVFSNTIDK